MNINTKKGKIVLTKREHDLLIAARELCLEIHKISHAINGSNPLAADANTACASLRAVAYEVGHTGGTKDKPAPLFEGEIVKPKEPEKKSEDGLASTLATI